MHAVRTLLLVTGCIGFMQSSARCQALLPADVPVHRAIDHYIRATLEGVGLQPGQQATEAALVRRLTLDLAGRIPSSVEVQQYIGCEAPDKRRRRVERLLDSDEFAGHMADRLDRMITGGNGSVRDYLEAAVRDNRGWDQVFRELVLPDMVDLEDPPVDFLKRRLDDLDQLTNDVSVVFFGINVSCAKCHDHPLVGDWTQDHFYGMKSFFNRTFEANGFVAERPYGLVTYKTTAGDERQARPMFLSGQVLDQQFWEEPDGEVRKQLEEEFKELRKKKESFPPPEVSLRRQLVQMALAEGQNEYFAKAIVNRLWFQFFGYGLVMPLDQMHAENPPSHPHLLQWLARDLAAHQYDVRRLIRGICLSDTYSTTSRWGDPDSRPTGDWFAASLPRPLTPRQLARSLSLATTDPRPLHETQDSAELQQRVAQAAQGRDEQLFDEPQVGFQVSASEALWFTNSQDFHDRYLNGGLVEYLQQLDDPAQQVREATWNVLSRAPSEAEMEMLTEHLSGGEGEQGAAIRRVVWALLTSSEFRFNH